MPMFNPPHPGELLKNDIEGLSMTAGQFAEHIGISRNTLSRIINGRGGITPDVSIRIAAALDTTPELWFNMQNAYDFWQASQAEHKKVKPLKTAA